MLILYSCAIFSSVLDTCLLTFAQLRLLFTHVCSLLTVFTHFSCTFCASFSCPEFLSVLFFKLFATLSHLSVDLTGSPVLQQRDHQFVGEGGHLVATW